MNDSPLRVVCATRLSKEDFFTKSATGRCLAAFQRTSAVEITLYANNSRGLGEIYNHAIDACRNSPRILVFVHDDCLLADYFWADRVRQGLENFGIVGIAGNRRRLDGQRSWIIVDESGRQDDHANLSGAIGQGLEFPPEKLDVFGPPGIECKLLDGVFLACHSDTLHTSKLRFDPRFMFHFYDMDFCRSAELLGVRMGTIRLTLVHGSYGALDQAWANAYRAYLAKWGR
jgi:GT2 family glycosyltransferase